MTKDQIMALADAYAQHRYVNGAEGRGPHEPEVRTKYAREALEEALEAALTEKQGEPVACPLGLESSPTICSAGYCDVCRSMHPAPVNQQLLEALKCCWDLGIDSTLVPMVKAAIAAAEGKV